MSLATGPLSDTWFRNNFQIECLLPYIFWDFILARFSIKNFWRATIGSPGLAFTRTSTLNLTSSFLPGRNTYLTSSRGKTIQKNNVQRECRQMTWQMIWSIWFTTDKWQYLQLWGNWSDINQQTVKYESSTRVLNCVSVLKPVRNWSFPLHAAWETLRGRDSIRAVMLSSLSI